MMSRREKLRQNMLDDIKTIAREQMAENGTAALSLSAIARVLEVSQPALYRYYASRDDLITALIVDAFNDLASALETADRSLPKEDYYQRLLQVVLTYRAWALAHPVDFQLIYGNPIPGYHAPVEVTAPASRRSFTVILNILGGAYASGKLTPGPELLHAAQTLPIGLPHIQYDQSPDLPNIVLYLGVKGWYRIHGMIMLEMFHHVQEVIHDTDAFYQHEVEELLKDAGLNR